MGVDQYTLEEDFLGFFLAVFVNVYFPFQVKGKERKCIYIAPFTMQA